MSGIATGNPFALLGGRKERSSASKQPKEAKKETAGPKKADDQRKPAPKGAAKVVAAPVKASKVVSLTAVTEKEKEKVIKQEVKEAKATKADSAKSDRHDKSGKGSQVRKDGKGIGGWEDNKPMVEVADVEDDGEEKEKKTVVSKRDEGKSEAELRAEATVREEEAAEREREEKQMTLEEYKEKLKSDGPAVAAPTLRTVDDSGFKGMVATKSRGDEEHEILQFGGSKVKKAATKKENPKDNKEKVVLEVGFRSENPDRQRSGGKGKGKGKGEGKGRGGYGGRGAPAGSSAPQVDDEALFPALGAAKAPVAAAEVEAEA